ncbi:MAG: hypothetical protein AA931_05230 [Peptococcaceae bacterium 1109]|nr:MAG: hypothetical protein AA931_05230 [Peptococcaceae bacterium 1109]
MFAQAKARGTLLGLAVGDALGQPTEGKTMEFIQERWGRITGFLSDDPVGSDDTEYAMFCARLLLEHGFALTSELVAQAWLTHLATQKEGFKGAGFSEMAAIENLRKGLRPPQSGEHTHSWSDGLAMRVAPYGIAAWGDPMRAAEIAEIDGQVSHAREGIYGGQAVAGAIAAAVAISDPSPHSWQDVVSAALVVIPEDSWTARAIRRGVAIGEGCGDVWEALPALYHRIACLYYHWSDLAPEAVGLAFGIFAAARGTFEECVLGGTNIGRDADTIAAIAGALSGALWGVEAIPPEWGRRIQEVRGICIKVVGGMHVLSTADDLLEIAEGRGSHGLR